MKKTTLRETEATYEDKLAMIMAVGDATIEEASRALEECGGNIDRALVLVYDEAPPPSTDYASSSSSLHNAPYKPSKTARRMEDVDDESIAKPSESLRHAPTLVARRQPFVAAAAARIGPKENVFHAPHQPTTTSPSVASANQHAGTINQTTTNAIPSQDPLFHAPGAFAIYGPSDVVGGHDDDNFTYTQQTVSVVDNAPTRPTEPVEAHVVDHSEDYVESLEEQLQQERETLRRREEELERIQRCQENIVVGQVLGVDNNDEDDEEKAEEIHSNKEDLSVSSNNKSMCASKRKVTIALVAVLVIVAVVVGIVVARSLLSPNECIDYLSSWAKQCVTEDTTYLGLSRNTLKGNIPSTIGQLTKMTYLSLSRNSLTGTIPTEIALMSNLSYLSLSRNSLTGTIPSQLGLLSKLNDLYLYDNSLTGEFTCPAFIDYCYISCFGDIEACRSL